MSRFPCTDCQTGEEDAEVTWYSETMYNLERKHNRLSAEFGLSGESTKWYDWEKMNFEYAEMKKIESQILPKFLL